MSNVSFVLNSKMKVCNMAFYEKSIKKYIKKHNLPNPDIKYKKSIWKYWIVFVKIGEMEEIGIHYCKKVAVAKAYKRLIETVGC